MSRKPNIDQIFSVLRRLQKPDPTDSDLISDAGSVINDMAMHFVKPTRPLHMSGAHLCPACHHRVKPKHTYCVHCGKRLWWD